MHLLPLPLALASPVGGCYSAYQKTDEAPSVEELMNGQKPQCRRRLVKAAERLVCISWLWAGIQTAVFPAVLPCSAFHIPPFSPSPTSLSGPTAPLGHCRCSLYWGNHSPIHPHLYYYILSLAVSFLKIPSLFFKIFSTWVPLLIFLVLSSLQFFFF